ncbi:hypothetical protein CAP48_08025 [Advenella sp. S44]|nr:hypothetical protein CAP48_08025 [Advenella sp. S44]
MHFLLLIHANERMSLYWVLVAIGRSDLIVFAAISTSFRKCLQLIIGNENDNSKTFFADQINPVNASDSCGIGSSFGKRAHFAI